MVVIPLLVCIASWIWRVTVTEAQTTTSIANNLHSTTLHHQTLSSLSTIFVQLFVTSIHSSILVIAARLTSPQLFSLFLHCRSPLSPLCHIRLSLCRLFGPVHSTCARRPCLFLQAIVSLLALSFSINTPSTNLEGSRNSISDITTTRKSLTPPSTTKVQDNLTPSSKTSSSFEEKQQIFSHSKNSTKIFLRRFEDLFCHQSSFFDATTHLFSNNTSLNTTSKNQHLTK